MAQETLGILEHLEGLSLLEDPGRLSFPSAQSCRQDPAFLGDQDFRDSQELPQVQQAPTVQVGLGVLFLLSFLGYLAVLDPPSVLAVLGWHLLKDPALLYLPEDHGPLAGPAFQADPGVQRLLFFL